MSNHGVLEDPQQITANWLSGVLSADVRDVEVTPHEGAGMAGRLYRVRPVYADGTSGPLALVAKLALADPERRRFQAELGFYRSEVGFYAEVAGSAGVAAPRCWHAAYAEESGHFTILLDELSDGWLGDDTAGFQHGEALAVAEALGHLHRDWWDAPALAGFDWLSDWAALLPGLGSRLGDVLPKAIVRFNDILTEPIGKDIDALPSRLLSLPHQLRCTSQVLVHGDVSPRNVIFRDGASKPEATLLDWGLSVRCPAALDLISMLGRSMDPLERRRMEGAVLQAYQKALGSAISYPLADIIADTRLLLGRGLAQALVVGMRQVEGSWGDSFMRMTLSRIAAMWTDAQDHL